MLLPRYFYLRENGFLWWSPVVLEILVAHIMIFVQMGVEYATWKERVNQWKYDIMFQEQYETKDDVSETMLRDQINNMILNQDAENKGVFQKNEDGKKTSKVGATYFTATYFALMKTNKKKLKMKESDQAEMIWKSWFIYTIQILFSYVILAYAGLKPTV